ncbi:hypothetical protein OAE24_03020 [Candidatus Thioglobus sp.]|nr:hypothetical protein [Candidatus Thioglobus sp.]
MKKLIALFAVSTLASTAAVASVAISGAASVSYDDNGSSASATTYDADLSIVGTNGGTTLTVGMDVDAGASISGVDLASKIGPVTITADMYDEVSIVTTAAQTSTGEQKTETVDSSVTVSIDAPIGDATVGLDNSGDVTISGTWSGVTVSHTSNDAGDINKASASIAGMDVAITNDNAVTAWSLGTTVSGIAVTLNSGNDVTATFGLAGNTMVVSHFGADASAAATTLVYETAAIAAYTTVAITRDLTSGASLTATYKGSDESLTLKAAVAF